MKHFSHAEPLHAVWWGALVPAVIIAGWLGFVLGTNLVLIAPLAAVALYAGFAVASIRRPLVFVLVFLVVLIALPPFFLSRFGETPIYVSTFLAPIGLAIIVARLPDFRLRLDPIGAGLGMFLLGTGLSLPFAYWLSGTGVGNASTFRWLLLAQAAMVYLLVRGGAPLQEGRAERWWIPVVLVVAALSAAYGIIDFFHPIPIPHPAADEFIWLGTSVMRRAQGVFYESANFSNFCAFFLVLASAGFLAREGRRLRVPALYLLASSGVLSFAVLVSFTRSAWANLVVSLALFAGVFRRGRASRVIWLLAVIASSLAVLWAWAPELWTALVNTRVGTLTQILADPDYASSGRYETWTRVISLIQDHPQFLFFGVGYKTLPYARLFQNEIITDNGFLSLLLETGLAGLGGFLAFSAAVFRTFLRLARRNEPDLRFWGAVLFSFWCGECVQMMAVDAHTFWRNIVVFAAFFGLALNRAERAGARI